MKKLIVIIFVIIIVPSIGYSADRVISRFEVPKVRSAIRVVCINSHKFIYLNDNLNNYSQAGSQAGHALSLSNTIFQIFET